MENKSLAWLPDLIFIFIKVPLIVGPPPCGNSCLVNLIDVTLACEDANSKFVEVVTVANVNDEDCIDKSLLQIFELRFGHKANLLFRLWEQGLVKTLKLNIS